MGNSVSKTRRVIVSDTEEIRKFKKRRKGRRNTKGKQERKEDEKVNSYGKVLSGGWRSKRI
jgi:hypothetical protein